MSLCRPYEFRAESSNINRTGLSHSEISGSKRICRSPKLIAAYHVLHRLLAPRHPSCALSSLFYFENKFSIFVDGTSALRRTASSCILSMSEVALFALYADVKEPSEAFASDRLSELGFPIRQSGKFKTRTDSLVGLIGLEPMTLRLSSACSNQLSYRPLVEARGFEPLTSSLQSWRSTN